jgi:hypothetical protein
MRFTHAASLCTLAILVASCAPTREALVLDTQQVPVERLLQLVRSETPPPGPFTGSGSVAVESPDMNGSIFFSIAMQRPDSILLRLEGPFGIDVGFLFMNRRHFVLYNAMENWYMDEPMSSASMRAALPIDLPFDQMVDAFAGTFALPAIGTPASYTIDDGRFLVKFRQGSAVVSYWIDPELHRATRYQVVEGDSVIIEANADRFTDEGGRTGPRSITLTLPPSSRSVSVFYSSLDYDPSSVSFTRTIPARARRRTVR